MSASDPSDELAAWLEREREALARLAQEKDPARLRAELQNWWSQAGAHAAPAAQALAARLLDLGEGYLRGMQQFARAAAGDEQTTEPDGLNFGLDLLAAWRNARWGAPTGAEAVQAVLGVWFDALASMPPTGAAREYVNDARELVALRSECQKLDQALTLVLQQVQHEALTDLHSRVVARAHSVEPVQSFAQLYQLWIECAERAYANVAHDDEFIRLQADYTNRTLRMRIVQRRLIERVARTLDLPTRAEVNALHLQVRDLQRRLNRFEAADRSRARAPERAASAIRKPGTTQARRS